jgi:hypothetical protein
MAEPWLWLLPLFFLLFWLLICSVMAWLGGWRALGELYPASERPAGKRFGMQKIRCGWVEYNGCVTIGVTPGGLYLAVWPLFRNGHPPLLLPWSSLHVLEIHEGWWGSYVYVAVDNPPVARLRLPLKVVEAAREFGVGPKAIDPPSPV